MCEKPFHRHNSGHLSASCPSSQGEEQSHSPPQDASDLLVFAVFQTAQVNLWPLIVIEHCVAPCFSGAGETMLEVQQNITAVLGEDAYLSCRYLGSGEVESALWKRQHNSKFKTRLAGYRFGKPFSHVEGFSEPVSATNLTVKMNVSSVQDEGEYECEVVTDAADYTELVFLTVVGKTSQQCTSLIFMQLWPETRLHHIYLFIHPQLGLMSTSWWAQRS